MGIYSIKCINCAKLFNWFSGNTGNQTCPDCQKETPMSNELQLIEALKTTVSVQADLISHLKAEVQRLNASQLYISTQPYISPAVYPGGTSVPWYNPQPLIVTTETTVPKTPDWVSSPTYVGPLTGDCVVGTGSTQSSEVTGTLNIRNGGDGNIDSNTTTTIRNNTPITLTNTA